MFVQGRTFGGHEDPALTFPTPVFVSQVRSCFSRMATLYPSVQLSIGEIAHFGEGFLSTYGGIVSGPAPNNWIEPVNELGLGAGQVGFDDGFELSIMALLSLFGWFDNGLEAQR